MDQLPDSSLVELARGGDQHAFAELYSRYFDAVYDFAARMMRNRDEAGDIAQDTFLKAMNALGGLHKGASFKGWIFTIARNTALNRIEARSRTRPIAFEEDDGKEVSFDVVDTGRFSDPEEAAPARAVASLVWQAAVRLDPRQLSLLDLHLRQGLDSGEIADVLGVTRNNGSVMLNRLKKAVEGSIGAFIMFTDGRQHCGDLNADLSKSDIDGISPEVRKIVERHVAQCRGCEERKRKLAPLAAFAAFRAIGTPAGAKAHFLEGLMQQWPGPVATGGDPGGPYGTNDRPVSAGRGDGSAAGAFGGPGKFLKAGAVLGFALVLLVGALLVPISPLALTGDDGTENAANAGDPTPANAGNATTSPGGATNTPTPKPGTATISPSTPATGPGTPTSTSTSTRTPVPTPGPGTPTFTPSAMPTTTNTPSATPAPTNTPAPTATTTPCTPSLFPNISPLSVAPGGSSLFLVFNSAACGASVTISVDGTPWLSSTPVSGTVGPSGQLTVNVSVSASLVPAAEGVYSGTITVAWASSSFAVEVKTARGGANPQVLSASGVCGAFNTFSVSAADDVEVKSVVVTWTDSGGVRRQVSLDEGAGSNWGASTTFSVLNGTNFLARATDGAGHLGTLAFAKPC